MSVEWFNPTSSQPYPAQEGPQSSRRRFLRQGGWFVGGIALAGVAAACSPDAPSVSDANTPKAEPAPAAAPGKALRIGYQKSSTILNLLKNRRQLEQRFGDNSVVVTWNEFVAGPQMLEALNVGSIDIAYTGETPPVFAQAAGAPLLYFAFEPNGPQAEAILVQKDSPIKTVADLKGKKVALNKGSNVHYLLVKALEDAGLKYTDIETAFLPPGDARPAFEQKAVDAWVIWDPFQAAAEQQLGARTLRDGQGLVANRGFFLTTQSFAESQPDTLKVVLEELESVSNWAQDNAPSVAKFLSLALGIPEEVLVLSESRRGYGIQLLTEEVVTYQQQVADVFYDLKLIPKPIDVSTAIWKG